jgi:catechol 2,3-dioxygenase-like lactoylglutathione lyase family enzyme
MITPTGLVSGHYECRFLKETVPILAEILALEVVKEKKSEVTMKHPNTGWLLVIHEGGADTPDKPRFNHYGVRVSTNQEVDNAHRYLEGKKKELRLKVDKLRDNHNAHSVHFVEPGGNWWEIESYEKAVEAGLGKTAAPHWTTLLTEEKFPGRGYIPQALTHGTIQCENLQATRRFYENVLGLEVVQLWPNSIYVKHSSTPWYVVNLEAAPENRKYMVRSQRFTLALESIDAVKEAHRQLREDGKEVGITELEEIQESSGRASFLLSDLNRNWWEIISPPT